MGCDIHYVIEKKHKDRWVGLFATGNELAPYIGKPARGVPAYMFKPRNYRFFANLAGVRGEGPEPLGMPEDASDMARMFTDYWGEDGHSHSHAPLEDFVATYLRSTSADVSALVEQKLTGGDPVRSVMEDLGIWVHGSDPHAVPYRVVYWFDN